VGWYRSGAEGVGGGRMENSDKKYKYEALVCWVDFEEGIPYPCENCFEN